MFRYNFQLFAKYIYRPNLLQVIGSKDQTTPTQYLYSVVERTNEVHGRESLQIKMLEHRVRWLKECIYQVGLGRRIKSMQVYVGVSEIYG